MSDVIQILLAVVDAIDYQPVQALVLFKAIVRGTL